MGENKFRSDNHKEVNFGPCPRIEGMLEAKCPECSTPAIVPVERPHAKFAACSHYYGWRNLNDSPIPTAYFITDNNK